MSATELATVLAEIAGIRAEVAALARIARIAYDAGHDEALHGYTPSAAPRAGKPRRSRSAHLRSIEGGQQ